MARLTLKDDGYPFKKICQGRKWIGRVWKNAEGQFVGKIGRNECSPQATERAAFEAVGAIHFGHASAADLHAHNTQVRRANSARTANRRALVRQFGRLNPEARMEMLMRMIEGSQP